MKEIQNYIHDKIAKRDRLWQDYDQAIQTKEKLISRFSGLFDNFTHSQPILSLSSQNLPPDEIIACLEQLEDLESKISQEKTKIQSYENKIKELSIWSRNLIVGLSLSGIVFLIIVIMMFQGQSQSNQKSSQSSSLDIERIIFYQW